MEKLTPPPAYNPNTEITETAIGYWLKSKKLQHTWAKLSQNQGIYQLIADGKLSKDDFDKGIIEIEEHGAKTIYLMQLKSLDKISDKDQFEHFLNTEIKQPLSTDVTRKFLTPNTQRLNYAVCTDDTIRIKFSETHEFWVAPVGSFERQKLNKTCFITYIVDRHTGFMMMLIDPPGNRHNHINDRGRPSKINYFEHFLQKSTVLFGESTTYQFEDGIRKILLAEPPIVICAKLGYVANDGTTWSGGNTRNSLSLSPEAIEALKSGKPLPSAQFRLDQAASAQILQRDLWLSVSPLDGVLKVRAECLAEEIEYAVSTIRKYQEPAS